MIHFWTFTYNYITLVHVYMQNYQDKTKLSAFQYCQYFDFFHKLKKLLSFKLKYYISWLCKMDFRCIIWWYGSKGWICVLVTDHIFLWILWVGSTSKPIAHTWSTKILTLIFVAELHDHSLVWKILYMHMQFLSLLSKILNFQIPRIDISRDA